MLRTSLLIAFLILVPALCTAGILLHPCECDSGSSCTHEVACESDPCQEVVLRPVPVAQITLTDLSPCSPEPLGMLAVPLPTWAPPADHSFRSAPPGSRPKADIPLRI